MNVSLLKKKLQISKSCYKLIPQNSNNIYMGTVDYFRLSESRGVLGDFGVYKSTDGGTTWEEFNSGLNHLGIFSLELSEENKILYAGTRAGGVYWISLDD